MTYYFLYGTSKSPKEDLIISVLDLFAGVLNLNSFQLLDNMVPLTLASTLSNGLPSGDLKEILFKSALTFSELSILTHVCLESAEQKLTFNEFFGLVFPV
jgi:hypothetical protein